MKGTALLVVLCAAVSAPAHAVLKPNLVFLMTDDQDTKLGSQGYTELGSLEAMPKLQNVLLAGGARLSNFFVNTPICCPSRTEFVSGRYYHNVGAPHGSCMHVNAEENVFNATTSIFANLQKAGYVTGVFGKVTNDQEGYFCKNKKADGMTRVNSPCKFNDFYAQQWFQKFPNGTKFVEHLDTNTPSSYQTSQIGNRTLEWLAEVAHGPDPFFAYIGPHAPHYPATAAGWYANQKFANLTAPHTPNYNVPSPDKHMMIMQNPSLSSEADDGINQHMRDRWSSLLSVDDIVGDVVQSLDTWGVLNKTYIFYSSDHGYHLGQWRVGCSKEQPYDTDIRVPTLVRGPGIAAGSTIPALAGNVDLAPTLLELAGATPPSQMDGHSLASLLVTEPNLFYEPRAPPAKWRDTFLIEYLSVGTYYNDHAGLWWPGPTFKGHYHSGPRSPPNATGKECKLSHEVGGGNCYYVDSTLSNSFRALRVLNETQNLVYVEFNSDWSFQQHTSYKFYELYDITADPYQLKNLYDSASALQKDELHSALIKYFACEGAANCP